MNKDVIIYKTKHAIENDVYNHLEHCNENFIPFLNTRVNIHAYAKKIVKNAITFEAWADNELIGLIATYFNSEEKFGFITSVSVLKQYTGTGIASKLLKMCMDYSAINNYSVLKLEVNKDNTTAINFYKKYNFTQTQINEDSIYMNHIISN